MQIMKIAYSIFVTSTTHLNSTTMKTELTLANEFGIFTFETLKNEEMKQISGGGDEVYIEYDRVTGNVNIIVQPKR